MKEYITKDEAIQLARKYHVDIANCRYIPISPDDLHTLCNKVIQRYIDNLSDDAEFPKPAGGFLFHEDFADGGHKSTGFEFYSAQQMRWAIANERILMSKKKTLQSCKGGVI